MQETTARILCPVQRKMLHRGIEISLRSTKKYRAELNRARRKAGVYGKGGKDFSHTKRGTLVRENASRNRARNRGKK